MVLGQFQGREEDKVVKKKKREVVHGAKNNPDKIYHRAPKNPKLREIKKILKKS